MMKLTKEIIADMKYHGADDKEIEQVGKLIELMYPCIRSSGGMYETDHGSKTALGLYRTLKDFYKKESDNATGK